MELQRDKTCVSALEEWAGGGPILCFEGLEEGLSAFSTVGSESLGQSQGD